MRFIISADWHIRGTIPRCRVDEDWIETQRKALKQVEDITISNNATLIVVGDLFHSNSDTTFECVDMVQKVAERLGKMYILAGNHDLLYHNSQNINKSAIGVLLNSKNVSLIKNYNFKNSCSCSNFDEEDNINAEIVFKHTLCIPKEDKFDFIKCETPDSLLDKFPNAKWIFTGDYHKNFCYERDERFVINPGCLLRQVADMRDYKCGVYLVDTDAGLIDFINIYDNEELVNDEYIIKQEERDNRIDDFVSKLQSVEMKSLDFIDNVEKSLLVNNVDNKLKECIRSLIDV